MSHLTVVGPADSTLVRQALEAATLLGYSATRHDVVPDEGLVFLGMQEGEEARTRLRTLPAERTLNLVHPSAVVSPSASLGRNVYIGAHAIVGLNASIGDGVVQNALSSIEHDNQIGAFTNLGTGAILCGHVSTGEYAFIGGGATIKPRTSVGAGATIGAGAVLVRDADAGATYVGNPARKLG